MNYNVISSALGFALISSSALAAESIETPVTTSSAELGMLFKTGNTRSTDIKAGYDFKYEKGLWRSTLAFDLLVKKSESTLDDGSENFETTDQKWTVVSKTNYTLNEAQKSYVYANFDYEDSRFGSFDTQSSISAGWGREWYKTNVASFFADIGPGYKRDTIKDPKSTTSAFIIQAQALYLRKINDNVDFRQTVSAKYAPKSGENSIYSAESSLTSKLMEALQLKVSFKLDHNTEVQTGTDRTDTETSITLVYSF